jgi:CRP-like cAMP-binding protein
VQCPLHAISEADLQALGPVIGTIHRPKGSIVFEEGDSALHGYIICNGELELFKHLERGGNLVFQSSHPGDLLGVEELLLKEASYRACARVREDTVLHVIPRAEFMRLSESSAAFSVELLRKLAHQKLALQQRLVSATENPAWRRLVMTLLELAQEHAHRKENAIEIGIPLTNQDLAEMVGVTPETISALLGALKKKGLVERRGRTFILQDVEELRRLI